MGRGRMKPLAIGALLAVVAGVGVGLYWFQPWKLWQDETVTESLPAVAEPTGTPAATPDTASSPSQSAPVAGPVTLASGI